MDEPTAHPAPIDARDGGRREEDPAPRVEASPDRPLARGDGAEGRREPRVALTPLIVPKETVSDDAYVVRELSVPDGARVHAGELVAVFETSKAAVDFESPGDGHLFYAVAVGDSVPIGAPFAMLSAVDDRARALALVESVARRAEVARAAAHEAPTEARSGGAGPAGAGPRFSAGALALVEEHRLDRALFSSLAIVRAADVRRVLAGAGAAPATRVAPPQNSVVIVGGGGHAKVCIDVLRQMRGWSIAGILDAGMEAGGSVLGVPVLGSDALAPDVFRNGVRLAVLAIGSIRAPPARARIYARLKEIGFSFPNLIHPSAVVEPSATLGDGNQIMIRAMVGSAARVGDNCIVNSGAIVSHDCVLGDNVHVAPGAVLGGDVHVGSDTLIGMGCTVYLGVRIGRAVVVNNGKHVFHDVPDGAVVR